MELKRAAFYIMVIGAVIIFLVVSCSEPDDEAPDHGVGNGYQEAPGEQGGDAHKPGRDDETGDRVVQWGYEGAGAPHFWGELEAEYALCQTGRSQSPVDISAVTVQPLAGIVVDYQPSPLTVVNNNHTLLVNYAPGSSITVAGKRYDLLELYFRSPSEHTIGGKSYDLEVQLVHKAADGQLGIVGVMFEAGPANKTVAKLWQYMPQRAGQTVEAGAVTVNAADLLPPDMAYFNYSGSSTMPPCNEGVNWMVLATPMNVSRGQVAQFTALFPSNARPLQPLNERAVLLSH